VTRSKAVIYRYFHELQIEPVEKGSVWQRIRNCNRVFSQIS